MKNLSWCVQKNISPLFAKNFHQINYQRELYLIYFFLLRMCVTQPCKLKKNSGLDGKPFFQKFLIRNQFSQGEKNLIFSPMPFSDRAHNHRNETPFMSALILPTPTLSLPSFLFPFCLSIWMVNCLLMYPMYRISTN